CQFISTADPVEQWIAEVAAKSRQRGTRSRLTETDPLSRTGDIALLEQCMEDHHQIEVQTGQLHLVIIVIPGLAARTECPIRIRTPCRPGAPGQRFRIPFSTACRISTS